MRNSTDVSVQDDKHCKQRQNETKRRRILQLFLIEAEHSNDMDMDMDIAIMLMFYFVSFCFLFCFGKCMVLLSSSLLMVSPAIDYAKSKCTHNNNNRQKLPLIKPNCGSVIFNESKYIKTMLMEM